METLKNNFDQSEKTVAFLREQLSILTALAAQNKGANEEAEIRKLKEENARLGQDVKQLKQDLEYYEMQNGVTQVEIPLTKKVETTSSSSVPQQKETHKEAEPKKQNKEKKEKGPKPENKGQQQPQEPKEVDVSQLNMKVGKIVGVEKHPDADALYVEQVDVGEGKNRNIVSGLVKHYELDQMQDRMAVFLLNLKPAKMRGVLSEGMIMCASSPEKVEILEIPEGAVIGDRVTCEGHPGEPDGQLNPKKKVWENIQKDLHVRADGVASYKGSAFTVSGKGTCTAPTMRDCMIK